MQSRAEADRPRPTPPRCLWEAGAFPCGFCLSGRLSALCDLPRVNPEPDAHEVRDALVGSARRCTGSADPVRGSRDGLAMSCDESGW
ncbi:2Fe-2S iron-sulfur cluster-binding protein [Streptomyces sp. S465]|uniref:2Fe-2S iron-sulfur cluster-binding protein n=1 Tax=Streptomyces sp. S465 TaxID=2979468 RepID=UPI003FCCB505